MGKWEISINLYKVIGKMNMNTFELYEDFRTQVQLFPPTFTYNHNGFLFVYELRVLRFESVLFL